MKSTVLIFYYLITNCNTFIIPNELPSILSIVYSFIPPVKVGIDTRFGYGFRLGPHADFQTLIELGPQTNTIPLSSNGTVSVSKRQSLTLNRIHRLSNEISKSKARKPVKESPQKEISKTKKTDRTLVGKIEFKKIPGIDDVKEMTIKNSKNVKTDSDSSPTKFVLF